MDIPRIIELIQALKGSGITSFKCGELEILLGGENLEVRNEKPATFGDVKVGFSPALTIPTKPDFLWTPLAQEMKEEEKPEIPHVVEELTSLLKLSDTDLVDRLFPEAKDEVEE